MNEDLSGYIFNVQHFSIHDGPGIRTLVHLKGCSLRCSWCCNPESQNTGPELGWRESRSIACGRCETACPERCIHLQGDRVVIDRERCTLCGRCVEACPTEALVKFGTRMTVDEVVTLVSKDAPFYAEDGGVTVSGGEPCLQPEFAAAILQRCAMHGFTTAVETAGHVPWPTMEMVIRDAHFVLYDLKHLDPWQHSIHTGSDNQLVLDNLATIATIATIDQMDKGIWLRFPLIPGVNDDSENIAQLAEIARSLQNLQQVDILPYHQLGSNKYAYLGRCYPAADIRQPSDEELREVKIQLERSGINVSIGG